MCSEPGNSRSPYVEAIDRYAKLLKTRLNDTEREFIQRRMALARHSLETDTFVVRANVDR
jgi:hypothetical protein